MYNILLIGAGELGSRHLQGLKKAKLEMVLFVVDTNLDAIKVAQERYNQVESNPLIKSISFHIDLNGVPEKILDFVIIATSSSGRAGVTKKLLETKQVKNILFEKFLFPAVSDYSLVADLMRKYEVRAWVNCPRRMFLFYKDLKMLLKNSANLSYSLVGGEWGLACNSIHFIDHFAYLTGVSDLKIDSSGLDHQILPSKRIGYVEFTGTVKGSSDKNISFSLTSNANSSQSPIIRIKTEQHEVVINESLSEMNITDATGNSISKKIEFLFQSQLTGTIAEQILLTGHSDLPEFSESANLHLRFLKPIINFYNTTFNKKGDSCPIT